MATPEQLKSLSEEATCPICLGYFAEPVFLQCDHTFCTPCITLYWERVQGPYPCPQCREAAPTSTLRPNRLVTSIVQILSQGPPVVPPSEGPLMCTEHDEKLKLFCKEDQTPICVVCDRSREHRGHTVTPIREAAQEYQAKFRSYLDDVKRKLESALGLQKKEEAEWRDREEKFKTQKERITSVFDEVQRFLEEEKCRHLSNLEEKETRALQRSKEKASTLSSEQALLRSQITEIESKCQQPDVELLKDVKSVLARFENVKSPHSCSGHLKELEKESKEREAPGEVEEEEEDVEEEEKEEEQDVADLLRKIIESLEWRWAHYFAGAVTLDPDTAHRELVLSTDRRSVSPGARAQDLPDTHDLPDTPKMFDTHLSVLGRERLRSGRRYWEVEVGGKTHWSLGVSDGSASRKGGITHSPERGHWAVRLWDAAYTALTSPPHPSGPPCGAQGGGPAPGPRGGPVLRVQCNEPVPALHLPRGLLPPHPAAPLQPRVPLWRAECGAPAGPVGDRRCIANPGTVVQHLKGPHTMPDTQSRARGGYRIISPMELLEPPWTLNPPDSDPPGLVPAREQFKRPTQMHGRPQEFFQGGQNHSEVFCNYGAQLKV